MTAPHTQASDARDIENRLDDIRTTIEARLDTLLPAADIAPRTLHAAQRHTVLAPGKRFRPLLCICIAEAAGYSGDEIYDIGCAAEIIHAASLILDDLPCMDDADLRRNRPTTHIAFDESTAILTATALLNHAFAIIADLNEISAEKRIDIIKEMAKAVGSNGLIAGQLADLANTDSETSIADVERLNRQKTGALFDFTIAASCVLCGISGDARTQLDVFADQLGLAFQLLDDMKDTLTEALAEKSVGRDAGKSTLLTLLNKDGAKAKLNGYLGAANTAIQAANLSDPSLLLSVLEHQFNMTRSA